MAVEKGGGGGRWGGEMCKLRKVEVEVKIGEGGRRWKWKKVEEGGGGERSRWWKVEVEDGGGGEKWW